MVMKSVIAVVLLFGISCNSQFIPGQQLNAHEQADNQFRSFRGNGDNAAYHQHTINFPGSSGGNDNTLRSAPAHSVPIQTLRSPIQPTPQIPTPVARPAQRRPQVHLTDEIPSRITAHINSAADVPTEKDEHRRLREQKEAESAHYSFDSSIQDTINDHAISRSETRDGLALTGMYSYSDGYFKRTIHYVADENGYRVVKEEVEPIGEGPKINLKGKADVSSSLHGSYSITAQDFVREMKAKAVEIEENH